MSEPYIGEIRLVGFNFAPSGWALCNGQLLAISENEALYTLIGTYYGGDGQNTFALPNLQGRIPVHQGRLSGVTYVLGQLAGTENVTLTTAQLPLHSHVAAANDGTTGTGQNSPTSAYWNNWSGAAFSTSTVNNTMNPSAFGSAGGSQPHDNMPPFLVVNFIIALFGIFPSSN